MATYKITLSATRERFMERPLKEDHEWFVIADDAPAALEYVKTRMTTGGWKIHSHEVKEIFLFDIREDQSAPVGMPDCKEGRK